MVDRPLHKTLLGIWIVLAILAGLLAPLASPALRSGNEVGPMILIVSGTVAFMSAVSILGHVLILRGLRGGGYVLIFASGFAIAAMALALPGLLTSFPFSLPGLLWVAFLSWNAHAGFKSMRRS